MDKCPVCKGLKSSKESSLIYEPILHECSGVGHLKPLSKLAYDLHSQWCDDTTYMSYQSSFTFLIYFLFKNSSSVILILNIIYDFSQSIYFACAISNKFSEMLFADDATMTSHSKAGLQRINNCQADACKEFGLTISLRKMEIMALGVSKSPSINIGDCALAVVEELTYLRTTLQQPLP